KASNDEASYSSPVAATINARRYGFFLTRAGLLAADSFSGKILFHYPVCPAMRDSVTVGTSLNIGHLGLQDSSHGGGAVLVKYRENGPDKVWSADDTLSNHYATSVHYNGFLYGVHGRTDPGLEPPASLRCVELMTGKVRWEQKDFGAATIILGGDQLL